MGFRTSVAGGCFMVASMAVAGAGYVLVAQSGAGAAGTASKEWPTYGHNSNATRCSPLRQITPENVSQLQVAWVYHMRPTAPVGDDAPATAAGRGRGGRGAGAGFSAGQVTPLVV